MGEVRVLTQVAGELAPAEAEAEQLGLFEEPVTEKGQALAVRKRGPGRPPGARNRRTERTVAFLLSRHRDPREVLCEIAEANMYDLAAMLGCTVLQAMQEKRLAAIGVLPYVAARITPEVLQDNRSVVYLTIHGGQATLAGQDGTGAVAAVIESIETIEAEDTSAAEIGDEP